MKGGEAVGYAIGTQNLVFYQDTVADKKWLRMAESRSYPILKCKK
jgi:hypothetical protein